MNNLISIWIERNARKILAVAIILLIGIISCKYYFIPKYEEAKKDFQEFVKPLGK